MGGSFPSNSQDSLHLKSHRFQSPLISTWHTSTPRWNCSLHRTPKNGCYKCYKVSHTLLLVTNYHYCKKRNLYHFIRGFQLKKEITTDQEVAWTAKVLMQICDLVLTTFKRTKIALELSNWKLAYMIYKDLFFSCNILIQCANMS